MSSITQTKNTHIKARKPLKTCAEYNPSSSQRNPPQQAKKWQQWDKYIHWPSENDQMELSLKFKGKKCLEQLAERMNKQPL